MEHWIKPKFHETSNPLSKKLQNSVSLDTQKANIATSILLNSITWSVILIVNHVNKRKLTHNKHGHQHNYASYSLKLYNWGIWGNQYTAEFTVTTYQNKTATASQSLGLQEGLSSSSLFNWMLQNICNFCHC